MAEMASRVALLAGASGFVGDCVLRALLEAPDVARVYAVTRRALSFEHSLLANRIVQFDRLETQLKGTICQFAVCCLGTGVGTGRSEQEARKVIVDYSLAFARAAKEAKAERLIVVSSVGADSASKDPLLRARGELEEGVSRLGFVSLDILRPAAVVGWRRQMGVRDVAWTVLGPALNPLLTGVHAARRVIPGKVLGAAVAGLARSGGKGPRRYQYSALCQLAGLQAPTRIALPDEAPAVSRERP